MVRVSRFLGWRLGCLRRSWFLTSNARHTIEAPVVAHQGIDTLLLDLRDGQAILEVKAGIGAVEVEGAQQASLIGDLQSPQEQDRAQPAAHLGMAQVVLPW